MAAVKKDLEPEDILPVTQREETAEEAAEREEYEKLEKWAEELKKKKEYIVCSWRQEGNECMHGSSLSSPPILNRTIFSFIPHHPALYFCTIPFYPIPAVFHCLFCSILIPNVLSFLEVIS